MAILATEKILTLDYWKPASKIQPGDYLFDRNGQPVRVKLVQTIQAQACYEVQLNDYTSVAGDGRLSFLVETPKYRKRTHEYKGKRQFKRPLAAKTVDELALAPLKTKHKRLAYSIPTASPLELPHQDLPVPPFLFGFWFFNQNRDRQYTFIPNYTQLIEQKFKDHGYKIEIGRKIHNGQHMFSVYPTIESQLAPNIPVKIPANYILSSKEQRLELLRGILCAKSRQYSKSRDTFRITTQNFGTIQQIQYIVESLGHRTKVHYDETKKYYTIFFRSRLNLLENQVSPPVKVHLGRRYIKQIEPLPPQQCIHIETDGPDNSYLVGEGFISCR